MGRIGRNLELMKPFINDMIIQKPEMDETHVTTNKIDLRKESSKDEPVDSLLPAIMPKNEKINYRKKRIEIVIDMELEAGGEEFIERLKLNTVTNINNVIAGMTFKTTDARGYITNHVKVNVQMNTK